jgi:hypothetical protein
MLILTTISIFAGIVLGLRFTAFILVPAVGLALALLAANGMAHEDGVWSLVATMVVVATFLQLGYIGGSVLRFIMGTVRATDHGRASMTSSTEVSSRTMATAPHSPTPRIPARTNAEGPPRRSKLFPSLVGGG